MRSLSQTALSWLDALERASWERAVWSFAAAVYLRNLLEMALEVPHTLRFPLWDTLLQYPAYYLVVDLGFAGILRAAGYARDSLQVLKVLFFAQWIVLLTPLLDGLIYGPSYPAYFSHPLEILSKTLSVFVFWQHTPPLTAGMKTQILVALGAFWVWGGLRKVAFWKRLFALYGLFLWMLFTGSPPTYLYPATLPWVFTQQEQITTTFFLGILILAAVGYARAWSRLVRTPEGWASLLGFGVGALEIRFFPWQTGLAGGFLFLLWVWMVWMMEEERPLAAVLAVVAAVGSFFKAVPMVLAGGLAWMGWLRTVPPLGGVPRALLLYAAYLSGLTLWRGTYLFTAPMLPLLLPLGGFLLWMGIRSRWRHLALFFLLFPPRVNPGLQAVHRSFATGDLADTTLRALRTLPDWEKGVSDPDLRLHLASLLHERCLYEEARRNLLVRPQETPRLWARYLALWGQDFSLPDPFPGTFPAPEGVLPVVEILYRMAFQNPQEGLVWLGRQLRLGALPLSVALLPLVDFLTLRAYPEQASRYPEPDSLMPALQWVALYARLLRGDPTAPEVMEAWAQREPPSPYHPFVLTLLDSLSGPDPERWKALAITCPVPWVVALRVDTVCPCRGGP